MLEIFFKDIPHIVFEPICILGWAGLLAALIFYHKKHSIIYLTVCFSLVFMIIWRCAIQIISARYAAILIFPMIVAAAFFICKLKNIGNLFPKISPQYTKYLPVCFVTVLTIICIAKDLNYNRYTPIMSASYIVKDDICPGKRIIYTMDADRVRQIGYYSKEKVCILKPFPENYSNVLTPDLCREIIGEATAKESAEVVYIFVITSANSPVISARELDVKDVSWQLVTTQYFNRKKKKVLRVYRYISESRL